MARDGSGGFTVPYPNFQPNTIIDSGQANQNNAEIAQGITDSLSRNGETLPTSDLPMANQKHTQVGKATLANQYARADQVMFSQLTWLGDTTGTGTAYSTFLPLPLISGSVTALTGMIVRARLHADAGLNPTLDVSGLGAKLIKMFIRGSLQPVPPGLLLSGQVIELTYPNETIDAWVLTNTTSAAPGVYEVGQVVTSTPIPSADFAMPSGFRAFEVVIATASSDTSGQPMFLRFSLDGGMTYNSGPTEYGYTYTRTSPSGTQGVSQAASFAQISPAAASNVFGDVRFSREAFCRGTFHTTTFEVGPVQVDHNGSFNGPSAGEATHIRLGFINSNIASCRIKLMGITA